MNHEAFDQFLSDHKIGVRAFASHCGVSFIGKSTVQRMRHPEKGSVSGTYLEAILPAVMDACRRLMEELEKPSEEIETIMQKIFEDDYESPVNARQILTVEEQRFFGLDRDPFALSSDPRHAGEVFLTPDLERVVDRVTEAVKFQEFIAVLGDVGAGKTSIKHFINDKLGEGNKTYLIYPKFADMKRVDAGGIVRIVRDAFDLPQRQSLMLAQRDLEKYLGGLVKNRERVALVFDECHRLPDSTLTALKNFFELGSGGFQRYLGLILYGQPRFKLRLKEARFREITERLAIVEMPGMKDTVRAYIDHRLQLVSGKNAVDLFDGALIEVIASRASTPLAIGNLCNAALSATYTKGDHRATVRHLDLATEPRTRKLTVAK